MNFNTGTLNLNDLPETLLNFLSNIFRNGDGANLESVLRDMNFNINTILNSLSKFIFIPSLDNLGIEDDCKGDIMRVYLALPEKSLLLTHVDANEYPFAPANCILIGLIDKTIPTSSSLFFATDANYYWVTSINRSSPSPITWKQLSENGYQGGVIINSDNTSDATWNVYRGDIKIDLLARLKLKADLAPGSEISLGHVSETFTPTDYFRTCNNYNIDGTNYNFVIQVGRGSSRNIMIQNTSEIAIPMNKEIVCQAFFVSEPHWKTEFKPL